MKNATHFLRLSAAAALGTLLLPLLARADELPNPLGSTNTLEALLVKIGQGLIGVMAVAATFMFIYGGVMMIVSGGNEKRVKQATETLKWTFIGVIIVVLAAAIVQFTFTGLGFNAAGTVPTQSLGLTGDLLGGVSNAVRWLLGVIGFFALVQVIWGGYQWLTSSGNEEMVKKAKSNIRSALIGIFIIFLAWTLIKYAFFLGNLFSGANTNGTGTQGEEAPPPGAQLKSLPLAQLHFDKSGRLLFNDTRSIVENSFAKHNGNTSRKEVRT